MCCNGYHQKVGKNRNANNTFFSCYIFCFSDANRTSTNANGSANEESSDTSSGSLPTMSQQPSMAARLLFKSSLVNPKQHLGILNFKVRFDSLRKQSS